MAVYSIVGCTTADGAAISCNNMSAFWEDPTWVLTWKHTTLEKHIEAVSKRYRRNLLNDRMSVRHQKAIDETGRLVGYARWILPPPHATFEIWPEALVPAVSDEEEAEIRQVAATASWVPSSETDELDVPLRKIKEEILGRRPYLRLDFLAVHPENKGKGIATALVKSGMRQAEKMGLDIFVLAFRAGYRVYKRLGFHVEKELIQDASKFGGESEWAVYFVTYECPKDTPTMDQDGAHVTRHTKSVA